MSLNDRLDKLEAVIRQKNKPTHDEHMAARNRRTERTIAHIDYMIAKAEGKDVAELVIDREQQAIDNAIINECESERLPDPAGSQRILDKIDQMQRRANQE